MTNLNNGHEITSREVAIYGGVEAFQNDYIKYAEALFSEEINDKIKNKKIEKFLRESKYYYEKLEYELKYELKYNDIDKSFFDVSNIISNYVIKILQINPIK